MIDIGYLSRVFLGCATLCLVATSSAGAPSAPRLTVDIAPQALNQALAAFGEQTGLQLFYLAEIAKTRRSKGARAGLEPSEALAALLEGTGLGFEFLNARAVRIFPDPNVVPTAVVAVSVPPQNPGRHASSGGLTLEEVTVTARRREEEQSKVPISMAVLSMEDLKNSGVTSIDDLAALVPSLWLTMPAGVGVGNLTFLNIRGVSDRNTSITGLYLDDTPIPTAAAFTNLRSFPYSFDLDRIEVLRGPQLQLFGEGNQAGAIRYIYNQPSLTTFTAVAQSEVAVPAYGDISYDAGAGVGGPLIPDVLGFRVSAWGRSDGGSVDRVDPATGATVDKNADYTVSKSFRGALALAVNEAMQIAPSLTYSSNRQHDSPFFFTALSDVAAGQLRQSNILAQPYDDTFYLGALKITARLGAVDFSAVSSYFHRSDSFLLDFTSAPTIYSDVVASGYLIQQTIFMQELRLRSAEVDASLAWDLGAFYSTMHGLDTNNLAGALGQFSLPGMYLTGTARSDQTRIAGFGEVAIRLAKGITLNVGLHSEHASITTATEASPVLPPVPTTAGSDSAILPQFRLSYQPSDHELLYFTAAKGYGTGGTWALFIVCPGEAPVLSGEETLWSYEAGAKSGLLSGHLQLDGSVFHMLWNNSGPGYVAGSSGPCGNTTYGYLGTPGPATSNGFDLTVHALAGTHVRASLAVAYADAYYTHTVKQGGALVVRQGAAVGQLPRVVSPWNITASVEYSVPLPGGAAGMLRAEDIFRSRNPGPFQSDDPASVNYLAGSAPDPSTNLLNLRAAFQRANYDVALFINNALDSRPTILRENDAPGGAFGATFRPRTVGLSVSLRY